MSDSERLFQNGSPNPDHFGFISLRSSSGESPDPERINIAAQMLKREAFYEDAQGCEHEIIGAAISSSNQLAYVESKAVDAGPNPYGDGGRHYDVSIKIHLHDAKGHDRSIDIESYNPYFGCDIRFFEWVGETAVLIYREKHNTYAYRLGDTWPPKFGEIEDDWLIHAGQLVYIGYKEKSVQRLSFPDLEPLDRLSIEAATQQGLMPEVFWR